MFLAQKYATLDLHIDIIACFWQFATSDDGRQEMVIFFAIRRKFIRLAANFPSALERVEQRGRAEKASTAIIKQCPNKLLTARPFFLNGQFFISIHFVCIVNIHFSHYGVVCGAAVCE